MSAPDIDLTWSELVDGSRFERFEDVLRRNREVIPDAVAVVEPGGTTTFADLDAAANRLAQALLAEGVEPGDRVAFIGENGPAFFEFLYGTSKTGAIPMALNFRLSTDEIVQIVGDGRPRVVLLGAGLDQHAEAIGAVDGVARVVTDLGAWVAGRPDEDPGFSRAGSDTALMFYTSGTTGLPKGIELTGDNISLAVAGPGDLIGFDVDSVAFAPVPFFHVTGLGLALMANLRGAALLLVNPQSPTDLSRILQEQRVSHAVMVPTLIQFLVGLPEVADGDWSALRWILYGGAPMPEPVVRRATEIFGCEFYQGYGLTESTGGVTILGPEDHRPTPETVHRLRSVGRIVPNCRVRIVDPATGRDLPPGERGEVLLRGGGIMKGYWERPEATAAALDADGWLHTGDGGSLDADGYLFLHDRLKDMIVSGGENVYPAEVESVLTNHPGVAQVAVIGVPSQRWGESAMAIVVRTNDEAGTGLTGPDLIAWSRERLAHFKCPADIAFVDELPVNASGKLLKNRLRERYSG